MSDPDSLSSTFERSCQHWSEQGQEEMDAFYRLASVDYRLLAEQVEWASLLELAQQHFGAPLRLLDVACGSGQFPAALLSYAKLRDVSGLCVDYTLLDPSPFSIQTAKSKLSKPFRPSREICSTLQQLDVAPDTFPVLWATHALYCIPNRELDAAIERLLAAFDPRGIGFIAHASENSHYLRFQQSYLERPETAGLQPYCSGEEVLQALQRKVGNHIATWNIDYEGTVALSDRETAEKYLQRCLFDDSLTLADMEKDSRLGSYLQECVDLEQGIYRFPQTVCLMFFGQMRAEAEKSAVTKH